MRDQAGRSKSSRVRADADTMSQVLEVRRSESADRKAVSGTLALAGNPNTGKSSVFNALTGLRQHTGNWPGKTVAGAEGTVDVEGHRYRVIDLPGTYSLISTSPDEEVAREFIVSGAPACTIVVVDATALERNLNVVLQVLQITDRVVVCLNLMDEARKQRIQVDVRALEEEPGVPVVPTAAPRHEGIEELVRTAHAVASGEISPQPRRLQEAFPPPDSESVDGVVEILFAHAEQIARRSSVDTRAARRGLTEALDRVLTSPVFALPIMVLGLAAVFWVTIAGANVPSQILSKGLFALGGRGADLFVWLGAPMWLTGLIWHGIYGALAWVVAVMLPPMAIFFPIFTILEDLGVLPRVALNMDRLFQRVGAHGKMALTMSMGFGCNAAGVIACRVIDSPKERLIAILTNNFVPCNGRFPTLILLATVFVGASFPPLLTSLAAVASVVLVTLGGIATTLGVSWLLSRTVLRGEPSHFTLELPPFRRPQILRTLYTSLIDRTAFVLYRAVVMAVPAGALIWTLSAVDVAGRSLVSWVSGALEPFGHALGLDGVILLSYVVAIPANEIVVPTMLMSYTGADRMVAVESVRDLRELLVDGHGWTMLTAINMMLFSLLHNPCSTTIWTIWKETRSTRWTLLGALAPLAIGMGLLALVTAVVRLL